MVPSGEIDSKIPQGFLSVGKLSMPIVQVCGQQWQAAHSAVAVASSHNSPGTQSMKDSTHNSLRTGAMQQGLLATRHLHRAAPASDILPVLPAQSDGVVEQPSSTSPDSDSSPNCSRREQMTASTFESKFSFPPLVSWIFTKFRAIFYSRLESSTSTV